MGKRDDYFSGAGRGSRIGNAGSMTQAHTYPEEFVDREDLEKLYLGIDFLNCLAIKLFVVALLCLANIEGA
jgi:hypothetical protein